MIAHDRVVSRQKDLLIVILKDKINAQKLPANLRPYIRKYKLLPNLKPYIRKLVHLSFLKLC